MPQWKEILIHHSAGPDTTAMEASAYKKYHVLSKGWDDIGYHFVVEKCPDGTYFGIVGRRLNLAGAHCPGKNSSAIGVCLAGDFTIAPPPKAQLEAAAQLVSGLCDALDIDTNKIGTHKMYRETECPGDKFDLPGFRKLVEARRRGK